MKAVLLTVLIVVPLVVGGCARVQYQDPTEAETVTVDFGSTDLQMIANAMVDDMLTFPALEEITADRRPVAFVDKVQNRTSEHVDTEAVTDSIRTKLIQSGKFRFVDMTTVDRVRDQLEYQRDSGMVDPDTAQEMGRHIGAEYMMYGALTGIRKADGSVRDNYYKFTLNLMNLETGIIEWAGEKEIRKTRRRGLFGL